MRQESSVATWNQLWCVPQGHDLHDLEEGDILDPEFQQRLEDARSQLRQEIQRELKIKEAAERMRRAVTSRKSAAEVEGQLKASSRKLEKLHWKLQELNARSMPAEKHAVSGRAAGLSSDPRGSRQVILHPPLCSCPIVLTPSCCRQPGGDAPPGPVLPVGGDHVSSGRPAEDPEEAAHHGNQSETGR